jgi:hypothetical protein
VKQAIRVFPIVVAALGCPALAAAECAVEEPRNATVEAAGASTVRIDARSGWLRVSGRPGTDAVVVKGTACVSDRDFLGDVRLVAERRGDTIHVEVQMPRHDSWGLGRRYASLNLAVEVPEGLAVDARDTSGDATFSGLASLQVDDSSGDLEVRQVRGDVTVTDSSGGLVVEEVGGAVRLRDSSGEIRIRNVGSLVIDSDGSGGIDVRGVKGSVLVRDDGSGGIDVEDVGGDFTVDDDGSGGIRHTAVKGRVRIPGRR